MTVQQTLFQTELSEKKMLRKFNKLIKCYRRYCEKYGYTSCNLGSLVKFLHYKGFKTGKHLIRDDSNYYLVHKDHTFNLESLLEIFRMSKDERSQNGRLKKRI